MLHHCNIFGSASYARLSRSPLQWQPGHHLGLWQRAPHLRGCFGQPCESSTPDTWCRRACLGSYQGTNYRNWYMAAGSRTSRPRQFLYPCESPHLQESERAVDKPLCVPAERQSSSEVHRQQSRGGGCRARVIHDVSGGGGRAGIYGREARTDSASERNSSPASRTSTTQTSICVVGQKLTKR